jgi:hypothetical protein
LNRGSAGNHGLTTGIEEARGSFRGCRNPGGASGGAQRTGRGPKGPGAHSGPPESPPPGITVKDVEALFRGPPRRILVSSVVLAEALGMADKCTVNRALRAGRLRPTRVSPRRVGFSQSAVLEYLLSGDPHLGPMNKPYPRKKRTDGGDVGASS